MPSIIFVRSKEDLKAVIAQCDPTQDTLICTIEKSVLDLYLHVTQHLIIDFDGTMTPESQCRKMLQYLPPHLRAQDKADRDWYLSSHEAGKLSDLTDHYWFLDHSIEQNRAAVEGAWMARTIASYVESQLSKDQFVETGGRLPLRTGVRELFSLMENRVVVSMGIEQMIRGCLDQNDLEAAIVATSLMFEKHGRIIGCHRNVVVSTTKKFAAQRFQELTGARNNQIMVVGDSIIDHSMMSLGNLNVLILPTDEAEKNLADFRLRAIDAMWENLKLVIVGKSFTPLVKLIKEARSA